jgi:adenine-specific DNA-methyltransferase
MDASVALADLGETVDLARLAATDHLDAQRRAELGQVLTPHFVAKLMADRLSLHRSSIRLLDPGAGIGSLTAAVVERILQSDQRPTSLHVDAYEIDSTLAGHLDDTLELCARHLAGIGIYFSHVIHRTDFISHASLALRDDLFTGERQRYDAAILNPPYRKIATDSAERKHLEAVGLPVVNLYTAFLGLVVKLLAEDGELVAITPRSFCNGPYHAPFRRFFLDEMAIKSIHVFESRKAAFNEADVLQENVIIHAVKTRIKPQTVTVFASSGQSEDMVAYHETLYEKTVLPDDPQRFIRIVEDGVDDQIQQRLQSLSTRLDHLGLSASTGRVVDFRAADLLQVESNDKTAPLLYPQHLQQSRIHWPSPKAKFNALTVSEGHRDLFVPNDTYVLVKRFTAKEEKKRVVAAVHFKGDTPRQLLGIENHLNYIHCGGQGLDANLARGLALYLNSTLLDRYFRLFSGHTQVNATDLYSLPFPTRAQLEALGQEAGDSLIGQQEIDNLVERIAFQQTETSNHPLNTMNKIDAALEILKALGFPRAQQNERSALTLLALLDLTPRKSWSDASAPLKGITQMMGFFEEHYGKKYAPNTRETVRRQTVHQFLEAGIILYNPDEPTRPINSGKTVYQIDAAALVLIRTFGTTKWDKTLAEFRKKVTTLREKYAEERYARRIPVRVSGKVTITLSPGGQNVLVEKILKDFAPVFAPAGRVLYVGDTDTKFAHFDKSGLSKLGVHLEEHGKMPDVIIHYTRKNWLLLIEAVTSHGPVNPKRHQELKRLFSKSKAGLVYVTAFLTRKEMVAHLGQISWETEVWVAESPTHMIHFNGERFLGPYPDSTPTR